MCIVEAVQVSFSAVFVPVVLVVFFSYSFHLGPLNFLFRFPEC